MSKENLSETIWGLITDQPKGTIFSLNEFYHLGNLNTLKSIFYRLETEGKIKRLIDGLYTVPKFSELLQEESYPSVEDVANKLADKFSWKIAPSDNHALNLMGLSTQVPTKYIYVSDGPYRTYEYRTRKIVFKHTSNRFISQYSKNFTIMIQAIKAIGNDNIKQSDISRISEFSKQYVDEDIIEAGKKLPAWMQPVLKEIALSVKNQ